MTSSEVEIEIEVEVEVEGEGWSPPIRSRSGEPMAAVRSTVPPDPTRPAPTPEAPPRPRGT
ncbi:hypothetical protein G3I40_25265 [Streptomyces sp. SID14478]|uniref:hypothetical protein n=1 Tax=Streptomyces sp. SID14478 TaxID=2706073 RepID=UPI0013DA710B|nr:hypothetical protein [Streptomyces sp. SID14478]NEB78511.1 hypothetical protein [Streptomyces sp. SID14478]